MKSSDMAPLAIAAAMPSTGMPASSSDFTSMTRRSVPGRQQTRVPGAEKTSVDQTNHVFAIDSRAVGRFLNRVRRHGP